VVAWESRLDLVSQILVELFSCQRNWQYLETIFTTVEIKIQLPKESDKFKTVDNFWMDLMNKINACPVVLFNCHSEDLLARLQSSKRVLEEIQICLQSYLETKRRTFPRFYFLSNDELLHILSKARNPRHIQADIRKCFESVSALEFESYSQQVILGMFSTEPEQMPEHVLFEAPVMVEKGENVLF